MSPSSAGRQRRSLPRSGSPFWGAFLFANVPECSDASDGTWEDAPGKMPTAGASGQSRRKGPLPLCRARRQPAREKTGVRRGRGRIAVPRLMTALRQGPGGDRSRASPVGLSATGMEQERRAPLLRPCHTSATGRLRRRVKKRLVAVGACHLRAFGLWKLVHRSTLRQRPGVPGNALRRIFRCLPVMGPGAAAGRVAGSGPVWKITTLLED